MLQMREVEEREVESYLLYGEVPSDESDKADEHFGTYLCFFNLQEVKLHRRIATEH